MIHTFKKIVKNTQSTAIIIIGYTSNGLRPKLSIKGMQKIVATILQIPVADIAYCMY